MHLLRSHLIDRIRRLASGLGIGAFVLVQMLSPLLHTHVNPSSAALQDGIHLPVALVHDGHGHGPASLTSGILLDEANAITAPPEHRRDEAPSDLPLAAVPSSATMVVARHPASIAPDASDAVRCAARLVPPAQGPPASA